MAVFLSILSSSFLTLLLVAASSSPSASACERCVNQGKAAYSPSLSQLPAGGAGGGGGGGGGSCGYGAMAMELNGGFLAAGGPRQHRGGLGCGRCFQMRCRNADVCSNAGVRVVLTDFHRSNRTDFLLGGPAFVALAKPGMAHSLKKLGALPVEYTSHCYCQNSCDYKDKNLSILVEEQSKRPNNLAIKFLYQGGQTDILAVDVAQVGSSDWRFMSRVYGPIWSIDRAPNGPLQFRAVVTGGYDGKWVWADREVLPPTGGPARCTTPAPASPTWRGKAA
ncbi:hypothetical protein GUJ93_ZPchr0007g4306 [Zizania palustris]|uniref:Expansin-like EG45 domain-containing protein n=1 Tax=Zizania palustris TaxID=103762 RepID=A0A8J5W578_ZIZPA|nr:hypothetical protein GUJ93_ZPchr0007g4306 [Zizania palustris]